MKTLPLCALLVVPGEVKKLTARGQAVRITDCVIAVDHTPRSGRTGGHGMDAAIERELDALLAEKRPKVALAKIVLDSRGESLRRYEFRRGASRWERHA